MFPFTFLGGIMAFAGYAVPKQLAKEREEQRAMAAKAEISKQREARESVKESMKSAEIELCLGRQLATKLLVSHHLDERCRLRRAERIVEVLESEGRRKAALRQLAESIEAALQQGSKASRKLIEPP